jgi:hypothetical protein
MNEYPPIQQFRIWSPEEKKYYYSGGTPSMLSSFFLQTATLHTVHKMPYQRDTFLKDKNGKEIYEGDVIKREGVEWWDEVSENTQIIINDITNLPTSHGDWSVDIENYEVIGNIYENPELLST